MTARPARTFTATPRPGALSVDTGVTPEKRPEVAAALARALADSYVLYLKTHAYHWNVVGPHFPALHAMFETQYRGLAEAVDEIAERIRALGEPAPGSYAAFDRLTRIGTANDAGDAAAMVADLAAGNEQVSRTAREVLAVAEQAGDEATVDLMVQRMAAHDKAAWMLRATLA